MRPLQPRPAVEFTLDEELSTRSASLPTSRSEDFAILQIVRPDYPEVSLLAEVEGLVTVRALVDPRLQVKDDDDDPLNPIQSNPKGLKSGYNPYNSGALGKQSWKKKKNLKELSKWIELRKQIAEKKEPGEE